MKCLVIGNGGREHAIAWKLAQSPRVKQVWVAPGNAGTAVEPKVTNLAIAATDIDALLNFAVKENIDLTVVGPELPLVAGVCDRFMAAGLNIFGPSQRAAELEGSKAYAKDFMNRHGIPTAQYAEFTELAPALAYVAQHRYPLVIKADGLAAGKGVFILQNATQAAAVCEELLQHGQLGHAGQRIIVEEFVTGEEASFIVMVDGNNTIALASSQDHKTRDNGDKGPNTGGMGAYSPAPIVDEHIHQRIMSEVIIPTVEGLTKEGRPYRGFLYAGLMITAQGDIAVLEYNCRLGDPETEVILPRLMSDFAELCLAGCLGTLNQLPPVQWDPRTALGVVLTAGGYPDAYQKGDEITGLEQLHDPDIKCFHAGTAQENGKITTNGGRVLCLTACDGNVLTAQKRAYSAVNALHWNGVYYRTDIGYRAIAKTMDQLKE